MRGLFSFGDNELSLYIDVTSVMRNIMPARRLSQTAVVGLDGALVSDGGFDPMEITVKANLKAHTIREVTEQRRMLAGMLYSSTPQKLILPDDPDRYMYAIYTGESELSRASKRPSVEVKFLANDPIAYGRDKSIEVGTAQTTVRAGGTYKTYPIVTAKPDAGSSWRLTNVTTGEYVLVSSSFTGSQTVVLDMANQRCTINGVDHAVDISSDFFAIDGEQELKTSGGIATLEWAERWI